MWARALLAVRGAAWEVVARSGTAAVAVPLVALAAAHLAIASGWASRGNAAAAHAFATSWAGWVLGAALALDAATAVFRALPVAVDERGRVRAARVQSPHVAGLLVAAGYLLLAAGYLASLAAHERFEFRVGVGEEFTAAADQVVDRDPPRPASRGPFPVHFAVKGVGGGVTEGRDGAELAIIEPKGAVRTAGRWTPLWFGWGDLLRPIGAGHVLQYELAREGGEVLELLFAKLDLEPAGKIDSIRPSTLPHRIYVRFDEERSEEPRIQVLVSRGKQRVAEATVAIGEALPFEGMVLRFPDHRRWVRLQMIRDPGIPLAVLGLAVLLVGWALGRSTGRRQSVRPANARDEERSAAVGG